MSRHPSLFPGISEMTLGPEVTWKWGSSRNLEIPFVRLEDGIDGLRTLEHGSVDLVLTDPPSGETAAAFDVRPRMEAFWDAIWDSLKPKGIAVVMASSLRFASLLMRSSIDEFRYDLVWRKSTVSGFLNARHRPLRRHEFVLVYWRGKGEATYVPQMSQGHVPINSNYDRASTENYVRMTDENYKVGRRGKARTGATDRFPTSVLDFKSVATRAPERVHPQQKPLDLMRWLVRTYSKPGDLVVDPFAGSGVVPQAATIEGRRSMGWDSDPRWGRP